MSIKNIMNKEYNHKEDFKTVVIFALILIWLFTLLFILMLVPITTDLRDRVISLEQEVYESHVSEAQCSNMVDELQRKLEQYEK